MGKAAKSYSIIGGADGPTLVFIVGHKEKNIFKRIKMNVLNKKHKKKSELAKKSIVPGAHTMEETIRYMKQRYAAVEADSSYIHYKEWKKNMKYCLIQREKPELLGEEKKIFPPGDFNDEQAVREWQRQTDEWTSECQRKADVIPYEVFPIDYHLFIINKGEHGTLIIELDTFYPNLYVSYSGNKKIMEPILKDIHIYFGVSQEDIDYRTDRYKMLLAVLSS